MNGTEKEIEKRKERRLSDWRGVGRQLSVTEGSQHYIKEIQSIELIASRGNLEGFALSSIIKYADRFPETRNKKDLIKIVDYAQILLGYISLNEMDEALQEVEEKSNQKRETI